MSNYYFIYLQHASILVYVILSIHIHVQYMSICIYTNIIYLYTKHTHIQTFRDDAYNIYLYVYILITKYLSIQYTHTFRDDAAGALRV